MTCQELAIRSGTVPALPLSEEQPTQAICLAWHARAECNTNCLCYYDYVTTYTAVEFQPLQDWCSEYFIRE
eukprot:scaffold4567_cov276-Chaetoceros_neogracile.AAC.13